MVSHLDAGYFDRWYADIGTSTRRDGIFRAALGLPAGFPSNSLLSWGGIAEVAAALAVSQGDVLLDLACGRGGYGLEIARRSGARLIGVDFSRVAIEQARRRAQALRLDDVAEYRIGELTDVGLPDEVATAVLCVDSIQFAEPVAVGLRECRRVLVPSGRLVLTGWEAVERADDAVSARLRLDLAEELRGGGFADVTVREMTHWRHAERTLWESALAVDPAGDPAIESLQEEGRRVLVSFARIRRVLATASAPA